MLVNIILAIYLRIIYYVSYQEAPVTTYVVSIFTSMTITMGEIVQNNNMLKLIYTCICLGATNVVQP